jgi:hypothetical protein
MEQLERTLILQTGIPLIIALVVLCTLAIGLTVRCVRWRDPTRAALDLDHNWLVIGFVVIAVFLSANQLLVRGVAAGIWDVDGQFFPYFVLVADHARAGRFVTWDPWTHAGLPVMGDPQVGTFSPITNVVGLLFGGSSLGFRVYWLLVWWLGGLGVLTLAHHLGARAWAAGVVALGFLFCGVYTGNAEHTSWIAAYSFLPLIIWRLDVAVQGGTLLPAVEAGAFWGLSGLGGYPGIVIITGCFCALWALGRLICPESSRVDSATGSSFSALAELRARGLRSLFLLMVVAIVGSVILSPTLVAFFYEGIGTTPRVNTLDRAGALANQLQPGAVATSASPYLPVLKMRHPELWPSSDASMVNVYTGVIIPVLALFAVIRLPTLTWCWWVAGLAVLALACAMGESLPLRGWLYDAFYPMRFFRHSAIFRLYFVFSICVLALIGTRQLVEDLAQASLRFRVLFSVAALVVTIWILIAFIPFVGSAWENDIPRSAVLLGRAHFVAMWSAVLGIVALVWVLTNRVRCQVIPLMLLALAGVDALVTSTISFPTVLRLGPAQERWHALDSLHSSSLGAIGLHREFSVCVQQSPGERCRRNDQLITKTPVFNAYATEKNPYHLRIAEHPILSQIAIGADRFWFSPYAVAVSPTESNFTAFLERTDSLGRIPIVVHEPTTLVARKADAVQGASGNGPESALIRSLPPAERIPIDLLSYSPREFIFDVEVAENGWLLVTERWARSWQVAVNGSSVLGYAGNFIFRAVRLSRGASRVSFKYEPAAFPSLVALSWGVLGTVAFLSARATWQRSASRKRNYRSPSNT